MTKPRDRRRILGLAGTAATVGLAGCLSLFEAEAYDVGMTAVAFTPETITVEMGETVVWKNTSSRAHTVTAYEDPLPEGADFFATGGYDSEAAAREAWNDEGEGVIATDQTFTHTFEVPGTYPYVCLPHETGGMVGTVVVEA